MTEVRLYLHTKKNSGKRGFAPAAYARNYKILPQHALVGGKAELHPEASYYLRYSTRGKQVYEPVGKDAQVAVTARMRKHHLLQASALGAAVQVESPCQQVAMVAALNTFMEEKAAHRADKTCREFGFAVPQFIKITGKRFIDEVTARDLLAYVARLRETGLAARTIANKTARVECFLRRFGVSNLLTRYERPRYVKKVVRAYSVPELRNLIAASSDEERVLWLFFLGSGAREREVATGCWRDVDFIGGTFKVQAKPEYGFIPKDYEERLVPLPDELLECLRQRKNVRHGGPLLFPNPSSSPQTHLLRRLKRRALIAGFNCGDCRTTADRNCASHPSCKNWTLHQFRRSYATLHSESGVAPRTIQAWLGHSDLQTTLRYLAVSDTTSARTRALVNRSFEPLSQLSSKA